MAGPCSPYPMTRAGSSGPSARCPRACPSATSSAAAAESKRAGPRCRTQRGGRAAKDPNLVAAEEKLSLRLGAPVEIRPARRGGGAVVITCAEADELMRVFDLLMGGE